MMAVFAETGIFNISKYYIFEVHFICLYWKNFNPSTTKLGQPTSQKKIITSGLVLNKGDHKMLASLYVPDLQSKSF